MDNFRIASRTLRLYSAQRKSRQKSGLLRAEEIMKQHRAGNDERTVGSTGRSAGEMTPAERNADIKNFGRQIRKTQETARAFLQEAGIVDASGNLSAPYRR